MDGKVANPDALIARIAGRQYGVASASQFHEAGISDDAIRARAIAGRLHRVHRGVYAVGHAALAPEGRWMAAVLALGGGPGRGGPVLDHWGAALSHRSAACLWGLLPVNQAPVEVIVGGNGGRAGRPGVRVHRSLTLAPAGVTLCKRIPVTTPARTIDDLRRATAAHRPGALSERELRKAIRQANVLGLPIGEESGRDRTRSDLEGDFLRLCRRHGLPAPEVNVLVGPYLVDFLWRERRLVVETDSYLYHRGQVAFQDDHKRDLGLRRLRYDPMRFSEQQLDQEPERIAEELAEALSVEL